MWNELILSVLFFAMIISVFVFGYVIGVKSGYKKHEKMFKEQGIKIKALIAKAK